MSATVESSPVSTDSNWAGQLAAIQPTPYMTLRINGLDTQIIVVSCEKNGKAGETRALCDAQGAAGWVGYVCHGTGATRLEGRRAVMTREWRNRRGEARQQRNPGEARDARVTCAGVHSQIMGTAKHWQ